MLCCAFEDSTYDILHCRIPRRIAVHEVAVEVHHNDTIVLFLKERTTRACNLRDSSSGKIIAKYWRHSRLNAGHHRERFCSDCTRWKRTNARIWREPLLSLEPPAWRCERRETDRPAFQFGSSRKPSPIIHKVPLLLAAVEIFNWAIPFDTTCD